MTAVSGASRFLPATFNLQPDALAELSRRAFDQQVSKSAVVRQLLRAALQGDTDARCND
jgi:hypothetical protein